MQKLVKDVMKENGIVNENCEVVTCVCGSEGVVKEGKFLFPILHKDKCPYEQACLKESVDSNDLNDERIKRIITTFNIRKLF